MKQPQIQDRSQLEQVNLNGEVFYKISNVDQMRPFFMSIVSDGNHWMFIGSNGGLSAGRKNANNALFPYYTDDKIIESAENTGSKTIFRVNRLGELKVWEPFSIRNEGVYNVKRNLYKSKYGNKVVFEEINEDLQLSFLYEWSSSILYGFVRTVRISNLDSIPVEVSMLDGIQNIIPYGVGSALQNQSSNLVDAYKRSELDESSGLGIFALSAIIVDRAEPSEALKANVVWSIGLQNLTYLLSSKQLDSFRKSGNVVQEVDVKAEKGAYFVKADYKLDGSKSKQWMIIANVNQNVNGITQTSHDIQTDPSLDSKIVASINEGTKRLIQLNASADGIQCTSDKLKDTRHFSNTLFNIMRGGIFDDNYNIERDDLLAYLKKANADVYHDFKKSIKSQSEVFSLTYLKTLMADANDMDFARLCSEYLPLKFSRRHGDPSRPWNQFSINTHDEEDGSKILDFEGNWRDIFQNWEALAYSYPQFVEGMIFKFLNASTFDGYNPYRITKYGIDWEKNEPDDPWAYIGYWGDHQIIYLLKFLEFAEKHSPGKLSEYFDQEQFVYASVPYRIKSYSDILINPKDTIEFNEKLDLDIEKRRESFGFDSAMLRSKGGTIIHVNFIEKILATVLSKMSNFIPEAGIWMNTQRPEWNDANNALVGNGVSMVTLSYLRRFLVFFNDVLNASDVTDVKVSKEIRVFLSGLHKTLKTHSYLLDGKFSNKDRKAVMDGLGLAASEYRLRIYKDSFSEEKLTLNIVKVKNFIEISLRYIDHTIVANKRADNLYHAYNLMTVENDQEVSISYLEEMLEGQVAVLSSGFLKPSEALSVLDGLKASSLFREDQYSYILYPNKDLPGFTKKNTVPADSVAKSKLLQTLIEDGNNDIILQDIKGIYHFKGLFKNASDLEEALNRLSQGKYRPIVLTDRRLVLDIFEEVFNHKAFTGRSGTFFGYEGLGSIYWHMVSKLQLAVQECCLKAINANESKEIIGRLLEHYYEINAGIGVHKSPSLYGAFPTDPYSHTPFGKGAQQPGMTGQVKEDILCRFGELGVFVSNGSIQFNPCMLRKDEFLDSASSFNYVDVTGETQSIEIEAGSLCFTYCQIPIVYTLASENRLEVIFKDGTRSSTAALKLDASNSEMVFERTGAIAQLKVCLTENMLV